jgi:hypothetical protein
MDLRELFCWDCRLKSGSVHGCLSLVGVVCCQAEVSDSSPPIVQRSPTECGVSECDREVSTMRRPWPTGCCWAIEKRLIDVINRRDSNSHYDVNCERNGRIYDDICPLLCTMARFVGRWHCKSGV